MQFKYQFSEYIVSFHVVAKITFPDYALLHQTVQNPIIASTIKKSVHCVSYLQIGSELLFDQTFRVRIISKNNLSREPYVYRHYNFIM